nr:immunoglobulin heavy chain junction region [Mus musculus]
CARIDGGTVVATDYW